MRGSPAPGRKKSKRPIAERTRSISIRDLRRDGAFDVGGELPWIGMACPGLRSMRVDRMGADITFEHRGQVVRQRLTICWAKAGCWPARLKFRCSCGRRAEILFNPGGDKYACKRCHGLHYTSQVWNGAKRQRLRALALRRRIGAQERIGAPLVRRRQRLGFGYTVTFNRIARQIQRIEATLPRRRRGRLP